MSAPNRVLLAVFAVLFLLPLGRCSYVNYVLYPQEVQRDSKNGYVVRLETSPDPGSWLLTPEVLFGYLHSITRVTVVFEAQDGSSQRKVLVQGGDLPEDHVPAEIVWKNESVLIREKAGGVAEFPLR